MTLVKVHKFVTTAGTAEHLVASPLHAEALCLQAKRATTDNTGNVHIGLSDLDAGVIEYIELAPGDYWEPPIPEGRDINLYDLWIDADTSGDGVTGFYFKP